MPGNQQKDISLGRRQEKCSSGLSLIPSFSAAMRTWAVHSAICTACSESSFSVSAFRFLGWMAFRFPIHDSPLVLLGARSRGLVDILSVNPQ